MSILEFPTKYKGKTFMKKLHCSADRNCSQRLPEFHPWARCSAKVNRHTSIMPADLRPLMSYIGQWEYLHNCSISKVGVETA